jgi:hypothetical protein
MAKNSEILNQARANVAARQTPANGRAVMRGEWDCGTLVQNEIARLTKTNNN